MKTKFISIILAIFLFSCTNSSDKYLSTKKKSIANNNLIMATLYNYYASEYKALSYQAYNIGKQRLSIIKKNNPGKNNLAVVVDIDETILDNSPYEAKSIESGKNYPAYWNTWCNLSAAKPVPGSLEFLKYADSLGFNIFYVSNRKKNLEEATVKNLKNLRFPQLKDTHLLLREKKSGTNKEPNNKQPRREKITSQGYEIVLLAGDNLGDFYEDNFLGKNRYAEMKKHKNDFGKKFIVLPNAMYGKWIKSIGVTDNQSSIDSLITIMTKKFEGVNR